MLWNYVLPLAQGTQPAIEKAAGKAQTVPVPTDWAAVWALLAKLGIAVGIVVLSYVAARWSSRRWRMPDHSWKIGLVTFAVLAGLVISIPGVIPTEDEKGKKSIGLKLGIDLRGGAVLVLGITKEDQQAKKQVTDELLDAIRRRVDPSGTKQITVRKTGTYQIEVIIPDVEEAELEDLEKRLTSLGTLEFRILAHTRAERPGNMEGWMRRAVNLPPTEKQVNNAEGEPVVLWVPMDEKSAKGFYQPPTGSEEIANADKTAFVNSSGFATRRISTGEGKSDRLEILVIKDPFDVNGGYLTRVGPNLGKEGYVVDFNFNAQGSGLFSALTTRYQPVGNFRYHLGIILNGYLTNAPTIRSVIGAAGQITGYENKKERDSVISILKSGRLPAQLESLSNDPTSPTLGAHNVRLGLIAMGASMVLVLVFMLFYYRFAGVVACLALMTNLVLILAAMITIKAALTLPGLAGLVLTVGMSVDANVLIFERIREEIHRGATMRMAIRNGFGKAMSTIVDANLTTLITAVVLYGIGTTEIKGFAVTLILGIGMSMFTAIFCSRLIFDIAEKQHWITRIKMMQILSATNIDFIGKRRLAGAFSVLFILLGVGAVVARAREGNLLDIDFTGGSSVHIVFVDNAEYEPGKPVTSRWIERRLPQWDQEVAKANHSELEDKLGPDLTRQLKAQLAKDRRKDTLDELRKMAMLDVETAPRRGEEGELRFQIDTPNRYSAGVEGIMTRLFGKLLLTNAMASSKAASKSKETKKEPNKTDAADKKSEKADDKKDTKKKKADEKKADEKKTNGKKKTDEKPQPKDEGDNKKTTPKTGALGQRSGRYFVAHSTPAFQAAAVLGQDEPSKKTETGKKDAGEESKQTRKVTFKKEISHDKLVAALQQAVNQADTSQTISVNVTSRDYKIAPEVNTTSETWTVVLGVKTAAEADKLLAAADKIIQSEPLFPSTRTVGDQVSGQMRTAGIVAILAALVGIVIYIWIRFQKIFFGLAAVVALVHDVAITLGAIAISGYLADVVPFMEAFKISLPIVAAFLTIIGYSLNDTIVVFDRIREVKGKNPHLTQDMVNRSINGTLSRTLLTSITTLGVVMILFFFGGQGMLHAFSFALVVGVLVGTYSSIFVASPVLLWLTQKFGQGSFTAPAPAPTSSKAQPVGA